MPTQCGGRRTIIFVSAVISIMALFIGFATSLEAYTWFVLVIGFCALSASNVSQAVLSEAVPCKHRRVLVATKVRKLFVSWSWYNRSLPQKKSAMFLYPV